jgi:YaiO family outer membrane protein
VRLRFAALLLAAAASGALAQPADGGLKLRMSEIELGTWREKLSGGRPDWTSVYIEGAHSFAARQTLYGGIRQTSRFDLHDTEEWIGYYHPLAPDWTALVEASVSGSHRVLPKHSLFGQVSKQLAGGWALSLGLRHSEYAATGVDVVVAGVERYWGSFRGAYTLYSGRPEGAPSGQAHRFQLNYYYGDGERSTVGVSVTTGREVENAGPPAGILTSNVRDLTFSGRHWMTPDWALSWDVLAHEQGNLYRRQGFRIGIRHRF